MASITVQYTIPFSSSIRIGYRDVVSTGPFTYITPYPTYADSPFTFSGIPLGTYEVELTTICPNCAGGIYATPVVFPAESL